MRIRLFWVGRTKERALADGVRHYLEKLRPLAQVQVVEIKEEKGKPLEMALEKEGERILRQAGSDFVLMDERGTSMNSPDFAAMLKDRAEVCFVIGGAYGVSRAVKEAARGRGRTLALSSMTFTHEMARMILLEQIYRAIMINTGRNYHH